MSVIFDTLQKIKHSSQRGGEEEAPVSGTRRKSCSLKRAYLPLGAISGIGAGLLIFFLWSSWGLNHVSDGQAARKDTAGRESSGEARTTAGEGIQMAKSSGSDENIPLPPPPELKAGHVAKGKLYLPPSTSAQERQAAQYLPPVQDDKSSVVRANQKKELRYASPPGKQGGKSRSTQLPDAFAGTVMPVRKHREKTEPPSVVENADAGAPQRRAAAGGKKETTPAESVGEKRHRAEHASESRKTTEEIRTAAVTRNTEKRSEERKASSPVSTEKLQESAVEQNAQMSLMVARVQQAMRIGDEREVRNLLHTLESLKGKNDDYVMRLEAFWFLKQRKYPMARSLLEELVGKNENDLESGINLAILDIKTNHMEAARKRLEAMRRLHEENTIIPVILEKISR